MFVFQGLTSQINFTVLNIDSPTIGSKYPLY